MGLDSYFESPEGVNKPLIEDITLCAGMLSGNGSDGSFRGKVYDKVVEEITGETLYQEDIDNKTVRKMSNALNIFVQKTKDDEFACSLEYNPWDITLNELKSLAKLFKTYANIGGTLHGWW